MTQKWFTTEAVAEIMGCTPATVRRWIREGRLKAVRPGGSRSPLRISEQQLTDMTRKREVRV